MKLLFDESIPRPLGAYFPRSIEILTVQRMGWAGRSNGDLLRLAAIHQFDAFVTADQGIEHQQNLDTIPLPVIVLIAPRTRVQELRPLVSRVVGLVSGDMQRRVYTLSEDLSSRSGRIRQ